MNDHGDLPKVALNDLFQQQQIEAGYVVNLSRMQHLIPRSEFSAGVHVAPDGYSPNDQGFVSHWHKVDKWSGSMLLGIMPQNIRESDSAVQAGMAEAMGITLAVMNAEGSYLFAAERYDGPYHVESWEFLCDGKGAVLAMGHYLRNRDNSPENSVHDSYDFRTDTHTVQETQSFDGVHSELVGGKSEFISEMPNGDVLGFLQQTIDTISS